MFQFSGLASCITGYHNYSWWVAPFGHSRINGYLHLPATFRSLSRPSSPLRAKASPVRPFLLSLALFEGFILRRFSCNSVFLPACQWTLPVLSGLWITGNRTPHFTFRRQPNPSVNVECWIFNAEWIITELPASFHPLFNFQFSFF